MITEIVKCRITEIVKCRMKNIEILNIEILFPYNKSDNSNTYKYILNGHVDYILKHKDYIMWIIFWNMWIIFWNTRIISGSLLMRMNLKYLVGNLTLLRLHDILYLFTQYTVNRLVIYWGFFQHLIIALASAFPRYTISSESSNAYKRPFSYITKK